MKRALFQAVLALLLLGTLDCMVVATGTSFVRKLPGFGLSEQEQPYWWMLTTDGTVLFACGEPHRTVVTPQELHNEVFLIVVIDPATQKLLGQHRVRTDFVPRRETVSYMKAKLGYETNWLADHYDAWVISGNRAYALSARGRDRLSLRAYNSISVVDLDSRTVLEEVKVQFPPDLLPTGRDDEDFVNYIQSISACPQQGWLFTGHRNMVAIWRLPSVSLCAIYPFLLDKEVCLTFCSPDGKRLYALVAPFEVMELDISALGSQKSEGVVTLPKHRSLLRQLGVQDMVPSPDWRELFVVLRSGDKDGRVLAIDLATRKVVRRLKLSDKACINAVVVGSKLFVSALDGVYVIDIDAWRKNPQVTQVEVK